MLALVGIEPGPSDSMLDLEAYASDSIPTRGNILSQECFLFSHSKDENAKIGICVFM